MSTNDQLLYGALHGTGMRYAAERRNLDDSITELRDIADLRDEVIAEAAGITAGSWYASPSTHVGHELVAAGLLIMAGGHDRKPLDFEALERWTRVGLERGRDKVPQGRTMNAACTGKDKSPGGVSRALVVFGASGRHGEKAANSRKDSRCDIQRSCYLAIPSEQIGAGLFGSSLWRPT
jgi:hypothetical protein